MASFKDFQKARSIGGVQLGSRGCEPKRWADAEPKSHQIVCSTSRRCRCTTPTKKRPPLGDLVSVICPTTAARRDLHGVVYAQFANQTHEAKELLVLDTGGAEPSPFFSKLDDDRVTYVHEPALALGRNGAECVGIKRNRLCAMARGSAVACFDDDNIYAADYVRVMLDHLRSSGAALLTLGAYYTAEVDADGNHFAGGWINSNSGVADPDRFLEVRGTVVGRAKRLWDKRGETMFFRASVFRRGGARFSVEKSIGEEDTFYRGSDYHAVVDDVGVFVHVDHGRNSGAPLTWSENAGGLPEHLDAALRENALRYRAFRMAVADGSAERDITYEPYADGWIQRPKPAPER